MNTRDSSSLVTSAASPWLTEKLSWAAGTFIFGYLILWPALHLNILITFCDLQGHTVSGHCSFYYPYHMSFPPCLHFFLFLEPSILVLTESFAATVPSAWNNFSLELLVAISCSLNSWLKCHLFAEVTPDLQIQVASTSSDLVSQYPSHCLLTSPVSLPVFPFKILAQRPTVCFAHHSRPKHLKQGRACSKYSRIFVE